MRTRLALALPALLLALSCKGDDGESSSSSGGEAHCSAGWGDGPEVDPDYPACGCLPERCVGGAACAVDGGLGEANWTSSVCFPPCKTDSECPPLGDATTKCVGDYCRLECVSTCPSGYVCSANGECQVQLE